eukprot:TRINITY_DN9849_c0_g1_i1.p1 TRINITY_DN9849_c0_g1~~TRINITY_DN9849_c0_g1_i1.p1  ORF type:complete len:106 (-),score=3.07 TRINITY_DN9849_c0_g1_i1:131-448(-)
MQNNRQPTSSAQRSRASTLRAQLGDPGDAVKSVCVGSVTLPHWREAPQQLPEGCDVQSGDQKERSRTLVGVQALPRSGHSGQRSEVGTGEHASLAVVEAPAVPPA